MSVIASAVKHMLAAGMPHDAIVRAVEDMEANASEPHFAWLAKSVSAIRQQRYRDRKAAGKSSAAVTGDVTTVTTVTERNGVTLVTPERNNVTPIRNSVTLFDAPGLDKESPPEPPKEINPTPKKQTVRNHSKPNASPAYPAEFDLLWREFAFHPNASKKDAFAAWQKLPEEDRDKCLDGAMAYGRFLQSERQRRPDYPALHLATFINQRRFDSLLEQRQ